MWCKTSLYFHLNAGKVLIKVQRTTLTCIWSTAHFLYADSFWIGGLKYCFRSCRYKYPITCDESLEESRQPDMEIFSLQQYF